MPTYLLLGASFGFAAAVRPGQFEAYLVSQTMKNGWGRAAPAESAITLYASNGFREYTRWATPDGIPMITLMRRAESSAACIPDRVAAVRARLGLECRATLDTIREIDAMIRDHPDSPDLWLLRGEAIELCSDADGDEARRSYEHALALDPSHVGAETRLRKLRMPKR